MRQRETTIPLGFGLSLDVLGYGGALRREPPAIRRWGAHVALVAPSGAQWGFAFSVERRGREVGGCG